MDQTTRFHAEWFSRLAREELDRGAVWMAAVAAALLRRLDGENETHAPLHDEVEQARAREQALG
jgi:hypothetical protein